MTEILKALPVHDRLEKIVAVEAGSAFTQHHMPEIAALTDVPHDVKDRIQRRSSQDRSGSRARSALQDSARYLPGLRIHNPGRLYI